MIRRNPHVFAGVDVADMDDILENWERIKREEKARDSVFDGIPPALPALALATKILARAERAGLSVPVPESSVDPASFGESLLGLVAAARAAGVDAEAALRRAALTLADRLRASEPG
jgi:XTP/dITP diphosphohydrolase